MNPIAATLYLLYTAVLTVCTVIGAILTVIAVSLIMAVMTVCKAIGSIYRSLIGRQP